MFNNNNIVNSNQDDNIPINIKENKEQFDIISLLKNKNILEIGAGTGEISNKIINKLKEINESIPPNLYYVTEYSTGDNFLSNNKLNKDYPDNIKYIKGIDARIVKKEDLGISDNINFDIILSFYPWGYGFGNLKGEGEKSKHDHYLFDDTLLKNLYNFLNENGKVIFFGASNIVHNQCIKLERKGKNKNSENKNSENKNSKNKNSENKNSENKNSENKNSENKNSENKNSENKNSEIDKCKPYELNPRSHNPWLLNNVSKFKNLQGYNLEIIYVKINNIRNANYLFKATTSKPNTTSKSNMQTGNTFFIFTKLNTINSYGKITITFYNYISKKSKTKKNRKLTQKKSITNITNIIKM